MTATRKNVKKDEKKKNEPFAFDAKIYLDPEPGGIKTDAGGRPVTDKGGRPVTKD